MFVPFTPGGSCLMHLAAKDEKTAWKKLLEEAPYPSIPALKIRGYTVMKFTEKIGKV